MLGYMALSLLLAVAFIQDVRQAKIANSLTIPAMLTGLVMAAMGVGGGTASFWDSAAGLLLGFALMFGLYMIGAVGAGDVKLFGAIGALTGAQFVVYSMMNSIVCAGIVGLVIVVWRRELANRLGQIFAVLFGIWVWRNLKPIQALRRAETLKFPFMYAVLPAMGLTWWTLGL
ncbi:MAG: peptidase a24a prepilin type iv [Paenibacillus sp.]|jgi:prepilin peptidase CpaA|nr:peptidase a24a prepilin type iv [Paenibacillus sp.]